VTSFLGRQLLADLIAAAGSSVLAEQQLGLLHTLLGASAAAAAMPGAGWEATFGADAVVDTIAMVLQVRSSGLVFCSSTWSPALYLRNPAHMPAAAALCHSTLCNPAVCLFARRVMLTSQPTGSSSM
jgi:hypothetical protein